MKGEIMRKIIDERLYDTETAEEIGSWGRGVPFEEDYESHVLYRKSNGEFFLLNEISNESRVWAYVRQDRLDKSWQIEKISTLEARRLVAERLDTSIYEELFGLPPE